MSKKRTALKYLLAGGQTAMLGAAAYNGYNKIGEEREPWSMDDFKKVVIVGSVFSVITWAVAKL